MKEIIIQDCYAKVRPYSNVEVCMSKDEYFMYKSDQDFIGGFFLCFVLLAVAFIFYKFFND